MPQGFMSLDRASSRRMAPLPPQSPPTRRPSHTGNGHDPWSSPPVSRLRDAATPDPTASAGLRPSSPSQWRGGGTAASLPRQRGLGPSATAAANTDWSQTPSAATARSPNNAFPGSAGGGDGVSTTSFRAAATPEPLADRKGFPSSTAVPMPSPAPSAASPAARGRMTPGPSLNGLDGGAGYPDARHIPDYERSRSLPRLRGNNAGPYSASPAPEPLPPMPSFARSPPTATAAGGAPPREPQQPWQPAQRARTPDVRMTPVPSPTAPPPRLDDSQRLAAASAATSPRPPRQRDDPRLPAAAAADSILDNIPWQSMSLPRNPGARRGVLAASPMPTVATAVAPPHRGRDDSDLVGEMSLAARTRAALVAAAAAGAPASAPHSVSHLPPAAGGQAPRVGGNAAPQKPPPPPPQQHQQQQQQPPEHRSPPKQGGPMSLAMERFLADREDAPGVASRALSPPPQASRGLPPRAGSDEPLQPYQLAAAAATTPAAATQPTPPPRTASTSSSRHQKPAAATKGFAGRLGSNGDSQTAPPPMPADVAREADAATAGSTFPRAVTPAAQMPPQPSSAATTKPSLRDERLDAWLRDRSGATAGGGGGGSGFGGGRRPSQQHSNPTSP
ncbi:hypothetical protein HK405_010932, partial [Cladochytrium tenue]